MSLFNRFKQKEAQSQVATPQQTFTQEGSFIAPQPAPMPQYTATTVQEKKDISNNDIMNVVEFVSRHSGDVGLYLHNMVNNPKTTVPLVLTEDPMYQKFVGAFSINPETTFEIVQGTLAKMEKVQNPAQEPTEISPAEMLMEDSIVINLIREILIQDMGIKTAHEDQTNRIRKLCEMIGVDLNEILG